MANEFCKQKSLTKLALNRAGLRFPKGAVVKKPTLQHCFNLLDGETSFVIKPESGSLGRGVRLGIKTQKDVEDYFSHVKDPEKNFILEEQIVGEETRALVCAGKLIAVTGRIPPRVTGDGVRKLSDLIDEFSAERLLNPHLRTRELKRDHLFETILKEQGVTLETVVDKGRVVQLSYASNFSAGGTSFDMTDNVDQIYIETCERAFKSVPGMTICGIDIIVTKDGQPYIIELNSKPMLGSHIYPDQGESRDVVAELVDILLPGTKRQRHRIYFPIPKLSLKKRWRYALRGNFSPKITLKLPCDDPADLDCYLPCTEPPLFEGMRTSEPRI